MINDVVLEGIVVRTWKFADDLLFRLACNLVDRKDIRGMLRLMRENYERGLPSVTIMVRQR